VAHSFHRPSPTRTDSPRSQRGQTLPFVVCFMLVLLVSAGLVIDVGHWYQQRQQLQASADAAALAGAGSIPQGWNQATSTAAAIYAKNGQAGDSVSYQVTSDMVSGDSVTVTASRQVPSFFVQLLGFKTVKITVNSRATIQSFTTVDGHGVMPWGVMKNSFQAGQGYQIYTDNSSSNNGALSLPYGSGGNCATPSGSSAYRDEIDGALTPCPVSVGESLKVDPGQNSGPTRQGVTSLITSWKSLSSIVSIDGQGNATILDPTSPQLVIIPIVEDMNGGTNWQNGSGTVRVTGFAYFVITNEKVTGTPAPGYTNNGKTVNGVFVKTITALDTGDDSGAWNPQTTWGSTVSLTA